MFQHTQLSMSKKKTGRGSSGALAGLLVVVIVLRGYEGILLRCGDKKLGRWQERFWRRNEDEEGWTWYVLGAKGIRKRERRVE